MKDLTTNETIVACVVILVYGILLTMLILYSAGYLRKNKK